MNLIFRWLASLSLLLVCHAAAERKEPVLGTEIIGRLIDPETRLEALREIEIAKQGDDPRRDWSDLPMAAFEAAHQDVRVTLCPQTEGREPLYLVTYRSVFIPLRELPVYEGGFAPVEERFKPAALKSLESASGHSWPVSPDSPHLSIPPDTKLEDCVFVFLTHEGQIIWPFRGANVGEGDVLKDLDGDGRYERVYTSNFMVYERSEGAPDMWVQALRVEAVSPEAQRSLFVLLNWHTRKSEAVENWGWSVEDSDGDGIDEILIGAIADEDAAPDPAEVFRWDAASERYVGAGGGLDAHFLVLDPEAEIWDELRRVRDAGGMRYEAMAAAEMAPADEPPPPVAYDWRSREPYRTRSLAGATDAALLEFICGWRPGEPAAPNQSAVGVPSRPFEFQEAWFDLPPKEAAFAFAEANQGNQHREKFVLFYPTKPGQPPEADWLLLNSMSGPGVTAVRLSGEDAGAVVSVRYRRPLPEKYPSGDHQWDWRNRQLEPGRMRWMGETLWWLTQLRSALKEPETGMTIRSSFSTNCYPTYMETSTPGLRLVKEGEAAAIDISGERLIRYPNSWRERFGAEVCLGLASVLYENFLGRFTVGKVGRLTTGEVFDQNPDMLESLLSGRLPPELAEAMIRAAGDHAELAALPALRRLAANMPTASEGELELARLEQALSALSGKIDIEDYESKLALERRVANTERKLRNEPWFRLRKSLHFSIRQLDAAEDPAALANWARQVGEPGAIWALSRLSGIDEERYLGVLKAVFAEAPEWRPKIVSHLLRGHADVAEECVARLPRKEQLLLMPTLAGHSSRADLDTPRLADLLETVQSDGLPVQTRREALRKLVPRDQPLKFPQLEIDETFRRVMEDEFRARGDPWPAQGLAFELGMSLLLRDQFDAPVELYLEAAAAEGSAYSYTSFMPLVLHLSVVQDSDKARD